MNIDFKKLFNWDIHSVSEPVAVHEFIRSNKKEMEFHLIGYNVTVRYKYHGNRNFFFDLNSTRLWIMYGGPRYAAEKFYHDMLYKRLKQAKRLQK